MIGQTIATMHLLIRLLIPALLIVLAPAPGAAETDQFPLYPCIEANVAFWKKVYSQYHSSQGLIHDSNNVGIVYEVVNLQGDDSLAGKQANERQITALKEEYKAILSCLAQGQPPATAEGKRVAALFGPKATAATYQTAAGAIRFQRGISDRFQAGVVRSGRYLAQIKKILAQYGLPSDLAYLPHVESSFDYQAYSKVGAAGIWQLVPATGRRFLSINAAVDERRDPIVATHAAAQFLKGNYRTLEDWPLALMAYNHGPASVLRAKNAYGSFDAIYQRYDDSHFGFASKNFYAEFLAAREVATNYQRYFPGLAMDPPVPVRDVTITSATGIKALTAKFKVDAALLAEMNPALSEAVLAGKTAVPKDYQLHLPQDAQAASVWSAPAPGSIQPKQKAAQTHVVKRGETIHAIAQRYGVSKGELIAYNQLPKAGLIAVGQSLKIPARPLKKNAMYSGKQSS